jgi:integrase
MAWVERRGPKRWRARHRAPDGRERSKTFERRVDAERWLTRQESDKLHHQWVDPALGEIHFEDWARTWLGLQVDLKPKTRAGYESILRTHLRGAFGTWAIAAIQPEDVERFVAQLVAAGKAPRTVRNAYRALSAIMAAAVRNRRLAASPCVGIALPRPQPKDMRPLTPAEVERLAAASGEWGDLIYFAAYTGCRWGEIAGLRVGRVRFGVVDIIESASEVAGGIQFVAPKNGRSRTVRLPAFVMELIARRLAGRDPSELVFANPEGGPLRHTVFLRKVFHPASKAAGLGSVRFHDLRHTCAALLIAQGAHPRAIMERLGHSTIAVTMDVYGHLFPSLDEALAVGLDRAFREARAASVRPEDGQVIALGARI